MSALYPKALPSSYRPTSLLGSDRKVVRKDFPTRILKEVSERDLLRNEQFWIVIQTQHFATTRPPR